MNLIDQNAPLRRPKPFYQGRNGFVETPPVDVNANGEDLGEFALDRHRLAVFVLTQKGRAIPSLQEMEADLQKPETSSTLKDRIANVQKQHLVDLQKLYDIQAGRYLDEAMDRYASRDDRIFPLQTGESSNIPDASHAKLETLYATTRQPHPHQSTWDDEYSHTRHTHFLHLLPLLTQKRDLEQREEEARRRREAQFPLSPAEFRVKSKEVQLRVVRFLTIDAAKQERMLSEFGWAWRQVKPLKDAFEADEVFKADVRAMAIELEVRDPRKKGAV